MKLVILTTDTPHHKYYVWKMCNEFLVTAIFLERLALKPKFDTSHLFEQVRGDFEQTTLMSGGPKTFNEVAETLIFDNVNDRESLYKLNEIKPDIIVDVGTGKLLTEVINIPLKACLNLHGGNPENYRGLDSHLWAIYNNDYADLITTLHFVEEELDTGNIIYKTKLQIPKGCKLFQLRSINTRACVDLSVKALSSVANGEKLPSTKQSKRGKYYSFMPAELKGRCVLDFEQHFA